MSEALEPSLIDYARFYGLAVNHLEIDPLVDLPTPRDIHIELEDEPQLLKINNANGKIPEERLAISRDEALLLESLNAASKHTLSFEGVVLDPHRVRNMKLELPMLRTDHEADMQDFARPVLPDLAREHLPLEIADDEADEGLSWPSECVSLPDTYHAKCKAEKLDVSLDILDFVRDALNHDGAAVEDPSFELEEVPRRKRPSMELVTPPLLPLSPLKLPHEPSSTTGRIQLLSEPISPTLQELKTTDQKIFKNDSIRNSKCVSDNGPNTDELLFDSESLGDLYSPLKGIKEPPSSPPIKKAAFTDFKVEVPLTPPQSIRPHPWHKQDLTLKESISEVIPCIPSPIAKLEEIPSEDIDTFFEKSIAPIAVTAERSIEQEQLQEADTMQRVPVPVMDFSLLVAPWKASASEHGLGKSKEDLMAMKKLHLSKHYWPGCGETERSLQWMPFPAALGRVELYECMEHEDITDDYTSIPECVDRDTLTWKPEGLRLLDELADSDEEELEDGNFPARNDIESLVRKRKLELEDNENETSKDDRDPRAHWQSASVNHKAFQKVPRLSPTMPFQVNERNGTMKYQEAEMETHFSAFESLENFMRVRDRGVNKTELTAGHHFPNPQKSVQPNKTKQKDLPHPAPAPAPGRSFPQPTPLPPAVPKFIAPTMPIPIVLSTTFLRDRKLIRHIQRLLPSADFIERDFTLHPAIRQPDSKNITTKSTGRQTLANEADLILSPSTGLILTTLQKIKQRSLPGQTTKSALHEHITQTAPRYERLLILVHNNPLPTPNLEPSANHFPAIIPTDPFTSPPLNQNDCASLIDFIAYCTNLQTETQVICTHGDGESLAQWIASLIAKHGVQSPGPPKLLQEETLWEIFLRRAGMNAFAAQVVLSELKAPSSQAVSDSPVQNNHTTTAEDAVWGMMPAEDREDGGERKYGLAAFVDMSVRERVDRFGALLGGGDVIRRVSRVLDARW